MPGDSARESALKAPGIPLSEICTRSHGSGGTQQASHSPTMMFAVGGALGGPGITLCVLSSTTAWHLSQTQGSPRPGKPGTAKGTGCWEEALVTEEGEAPCPGSWCRNSYRTF